MLPVNTYCYQSPNKYKLSQNVNERDDWTGWTGVGQFIDSQFIDTQFIDTQFIDSLFIDTQFIDTTV